jgi:multidrug efflux pump subunit AcrA (membrane-fusion protein)
VNTISAFVRRHGKAVTTTLVVIAIGIAAAVTAPRWWPLAAELAGVRDAAEQHEHEHPDEQAYADEHDHAHEDTADEHEYEPAAGAGDHAGHDPAASLRLSEQAGRNIGLELHTVQRRDFQRTVTIPSVVVGRPARSEITVSAPMTGIITRVYPIRGEAVAPGDPLFDLRLTHEDLVEKQTALLRDLEQLDVVKQEIERLEEVTSSGAVAAKTLLEKVYERQTIEGAMRAEREALLLHGLSDDQVAQIENQRQLVREILVRAPQTESAEHAEQHEDYLQVNNFGVTRGDHVVTGTPLATLTDHCQLYIEGQAFEQDADALNEAVNRGAPVSALVETGDGSKRELSGLRLLYVENQVEQDTRALKFYVSLPNELWRNDVTPDGHRFIAWRFRPGQRVEVLVPVEVWTDRIVVPIEAVIQEGPEWFVFRKFGDHFDRQAVHVEYRDQRWAVIDDDGSLHAGDRLATRGAYAIHLAIKNQTGGAVDPHAGHGH